MSFIVPGAYRRSATRCRQELDRLRTNHQDDWTIGPRVGEFNRSQVHMSVCPHAVQHIRFAHETRNESCFGLRIDCFGRSLLHYSAHIHHRHPVGQGQSFRLIMGDEYESSANVAMNTSQLLLHDLAELVPIVNQIRTY